LQIRKTVKREQIKPEVSTRKEIKKTAEIKQEKIKKINFPSTENKKIN
jgi:hypothetical protein